MLGMRIAQGPPTDERPNQGKAMNRLFTSCYASLIGLLLAALGACDPAGPGASGTIRVAPSVPVAKFTTLEIRTYADQNPTFDVKDIPSESPSRVELPLATTSFPFQYNAGEALGTTEQAQWRMTAWLSSDDAAVAPKADDPQCSVAFSLNKCSAQFGDYCGDTANVNCTIQ